MRDKQNKTKMYTSLFIIGVMMLSTFAVIGSFTSPQDFGYNGFDFERRDGRWVTTIESGTEEKEYVFFFHPAELPVYLPLEIEDVLREPGPIVITFNPNATELQYADAARFELSQFLTGDLGKAVSTGVSNQTTAYDFPVIPCVANASQLVLSFDEGENGASKNGTCIRIEVTNPAEYIAYAERIIYGLLGII